MTACSPGELNYWVIWKVLLASKEARQILPRLMYSPIQKALSRLRSFASAKPNMYEIAQLVFKLLQKSLLEMFPTKIKSQLSWKPPPLQVAICKNWNTNSTGGHTAEGSLITYSTKGDSLHKMPPRSCPSYSLSTKNTLCGAHWYLDV